MDYANCILETSDKGYVIAGESASFGEWPGDFWLLKTEGPPPVGGIEIPVDKLALLTPYIALAVVVVAIVTGAVYIGRRWFRRLIALKP